MLDLALVGYSIFRWRELNALWKRNSPVARRLSIKALGPWSGFVFTMRTARSFQKPIRRIPLQNSRGSARKGSAQRFEGYASLLDEQMARISVRANGNRKVSPKR